jgi:hypothetical protein
MFPKSDEPNSESTNAMPPTSRCDMGKLLDLLEREASDWQRIGSENTLPVIFTKRRRVGGDHANRPTCARRSSNIIPAAWSRDNFRCVAAL